MPKFKETAAFEDLQTRVCHEIVGVILGRLKEVEVPDDKLEQVSDDICYDLLAAMSEIGKYQVPGAEVYAEILRDKLKEMSVLEAKLEEMAALETKLGEMAALETKLGEMAALEAKLEKMAALEAKLGEMTAQEAMIKEMGAKEERFNWVFDVDEKFDHITTEQAWSDKIPIKNEQIWADKIVLKKAEEDNQYHHPDKNILSLDKALSILNATKSA